MKRLVVVLAAVLLSVPAAYSALSQEYLKRKMEKWLTVNDRNGAKPNVSAPGEVQVNTYNGNMLLQREDLFIPGLGLNLELLFSYNSGLTKNDWGFGRGWTAGFNMMVERQPWGVLVRREDGQKDRYTGAGVLSPPAGVFDELTEYAPGKFRLRSRHGTTYFFDDSTHKHLTSIRDRNGNTVTFSGFLPWGQPQYITDPGGRSLRLVWSGGRLTEVIDSVSSPTRVLSYHYDARGNMVRFTDPAGNAVHYTYDARSRLVAITDPRANVVNVAYNDSGAVVAVTTPGTADTPPTAMQFVYDVPARRTTVTELVSGALQAGIYTYDTQGRVIRIQSNAPGYDVQYEYDAANNITRTVDANGNPTVCTYDARGNRLTETNALSQTASWTYDPLFNRVTSFTDRRGNTTGYAYDARGNLLSITHPLGITESFTYDAAGNMLSSTDGRGNTTSTTYDAAGNVASVSRPIGSESFSHDSRGNLVSWTDPNGRTTTFSYDLLNRRTAMTTPLPATTSYGYDANGNLTSVTDPNGHTTSFSYDARDRVYKITVPAGQRLLSRNARGNVIQDQDLNGNITSYAYDSRNRLVSITDPLGLSTTFTYDNSGNILSETDPNGHTTGYLYDALDRMISITDPLAHITAVTYDANDNTATITDANGHVTAFTYDALNRRTLATFPIGSSTCTYDQNGNVLTATDPNGHTTAYTYDALDRLVSVLDPLLHASGFTYDAAGNTLSSTNPNGLATTYAYDAADRLTAVTNPMLEVTGFSYDAAGNRTAVSFPNGNVVSYTYDASDRITAAADLLGSLGGATYDPNGNLLSSTDPNGNTTQYGYDALGRMVSVTEPLGQSTVFGYDNAGNLVSVTDGAGNTVTYTYDAMDRKLTETIPGGGTTARTYDPVGNLLSILDGRGNPTSFTYDAMDRVTQIAYANGSVRNQTFDVGGRRLTLQDQNASTLTYTYDALDRLLSRSFPDGTADVFTYDNAGRLLTATNASGDVAFTYDGADRVVSEVLNGKTTTYGWNIPGRTATVTSPGGVTTTTTMDMRLRTSSFKIAASYPAGTYSYDGASRLVSSELGNGILASHGYDNNDRETATSISRSGASLASFLTTYDSRGFRTTVHKLHNPGRSEKFVYDAAWRLRGYKEGVLVGGDIPAPVTQSEFTLDAAGNRTSVAKDGVPTAYTANTINAYTSITGGLSLTPVYDGNGNMISDGGRLYGYDYMDRLISAQDVATDAEYDYDALGRRIRKTVNGVQTRYYYDGGLVIEERDSTDAVTATYAYGDDVEDVVAMTRYSSGLARTFHFHQNTLGSVVAATDDSGQVVERYEYDPFGAVSVYDSAYTPRGGSAIGNTRLYAGMELDPETGLYAAGFRHYSPVLGRFLQQDPASLMGDPPDTRNGYSYAGGNPANFIDPEGAAVRLPRPRGWDGTIRRVFDDEGNGLRVTGGRKGWDGTIKGRVFDDEEGALGIGGRRKGWDGTIKGSNFDDEGGALRYGGGRKGWDGTVKGFTFDHDGGGLSIGGTRKGWDGTVKGSTVTDEAVIVLWASKKGYDYYKAHGDLNSARSGGKTGHVTLMKAYDDGSEAMGLSKKGYDYYQAQSSLSSARGGKTGHVIIMKAYDDVDELLAGRHTKTGHVTLLKAFDDDDGSLTARHTKTGHVTLLKAFDDESGDARVVSRTGYSAYSALAQEIQGSVSKEKTGHVTLIKITGQAEELARAGYVKTGHVTLMKRTAAAGMLVPGSSGKKEFKGHVTLLK